MHLISQKAEQHSALENLQGFLVGTLLVALSVHLLKGASLFTGQLAGLSLIAHYTSDVPFWIWFSALNLPFYILAVLRLGWAFTLRTVAAVIALSVFTALLDRTVSFDVLHPAAASTLAGVTAGAGLLALFRHGASLGGVGIVALWLQDSRGIRAGLTQLAFDCGVFLLALALFPVSTVLWSLLGAAVLNVVIAFNHRRDRYIAR